MFIVTISSFIMVCVVANLSYLSATSTNLINNGAFATGDFTDWTTGGNFFSYSVRGGGGQGSSAYYAQLGPVSSDGYLSQTFTDVLGTQYNISFWLLANGDNPSDFGVTWDGTTLLTLTNPNSGGVWIQYSYVVNGTGMDTLLFNFRDDPSYIFLDNIEVIAIGTGEPSSLPTSTPTHRSTSLPTSLPTALPSSLPSSTPTSLPTSKPSDTPTSLPTALPSSLPSSTPTSLPTSNPSVLPSAHPTGLPTDQPSSLPTNTPFIYEVHGQESGDIAGVTSNQNLAIFTVIPFFVIIFAAVLLYWFLAVEVGVLENAFSMWLGVIVMILSLSQSAITGVVDGSLTSPKAGSWWIGICCFVAGASVIVQKSTLEVLSALLLLSAVVIAFISTVIDGMYCYQVLLAINACRNIDNIPYGEESYFAQAHICHFQSPNHDLACIDNRNKRCFYFDGIKDGNYLLHGYTQLMETGFVIEVVLLAVITILLIWHTWSLFPVKENQSNVINSYIVPGDHDEKRIQDLNQSEITI